MDKSYKIVVFGCQMNKSDAERIAAVLRKSGYVEIEDENKADILLIVSCSVRQKGVDRVFGKARLWQENRKKGAMTILTGCVAESDRKKFENKFDFIFNIKNLWQLEKFLFEKETLPKDYLKVAPKYESSFQAFIPIMTGCDNFCSYCVVPLTRGREESARVKDLISQIKSFIASGGQEITLLGQNVNSYKPEDLDSFSVENPYENNFAKLLWELNKLDGLKRINFTASHPKDMSDDLINALTLPKQMNFLHLAVQSGSNEILKSMNRKYTVEDYLKIIEKVRQVKPDIALATDIIVGFSGETQKDFQDTIDLYDKVKFDIAYLARFSPRPGTAAAKLPDDVSREEKKSRWEELQKLNVKYSLENNQKYLGKTVSVLIDKKVAENIWEGNSLEMKRVRIESDKDLLGKIIDVKVKEAKEWILIGGVV
ncbi:MAG TPA: tRNA (N6-isopentenyl adenosine(37)-C2)-methylthiotransferase MiaB [Candidatus Bipolaricaulota bacterium]|nr:tRNA (N6-isopentenyl adenosine(37)-C2)-methylthiotransferase MiaB [Candidatus Bipolaricaulota bacterium]